MNPTISCGRCGKETSIDDAVSTDGLEGRFCSEACIVACLRAHPYIVPFPGQHMAQAGDPDPGNARQFDDTDERRTRDGDIA